MFTMDFFHDTDLDTERLSNSCRTGLTLENNQLEMLKRCDLNDEVTDSVP